MKKIILLMMVAIAIFSSCSNRESQFIKINGFAQGTTYSMAYRDSLKRNLKVQVDSILRDFDLSLSIYEKMSIISRINSNDTTVRTDRYFEECYNHSVKITKETDGAFDITVGPLVQAWGFGLKHRDKMTQHKVDSLLPLVGMRMISLQNHRLIKADPRMFIDVNAIAQGYSVDVIARYFESLGIKEYMVEIGGEVFCRGLNAKGNSWVIGIDKPYDNNNTPGESLQAKVGLPSGKALCTSGSYRKFFEENGVKYSHEIDPKTGFPAKNTLLSVSVIASSCADADGYATAFMVMGTEKTKAFLAKRPDLEGYLIFSGPKGEFLTFATPGFQKFIKE